MAKKPKASAPSNSRSQSQPSSDPVTDADHGRAALLAWKQLLVARGNRLLELAARERMPVSDGDAESETSPTCSRSGVVRKGNRARSQSLAQEL